MPTIFFDIGDTLGSAQVDPDSHKLRSISVFPNVIPILTDLKSRGIKLGIISNTGDEKADRVNRILKDCGLFDFFESDLLLYSAEVKLKKDSPAIFQLAIKAAKLEDNPASCMFVGEDAGERAFAVEAGMKACPHPTAIDYVLL